VRQDVQITPCAARRGPHLGHGAERLGRGPAGFDHRRRLGFGVFQRRQALRFGGQEDVHLQARFLELPAQDLQFLLRMRARRLGGHCGFVLDAFGFAVELRLNCAQLVLTREHEGLGLFDGGL
jgi:hypothetical protein